MNLRKVSFYALLVVGVGLCVGGVFVPVLLPVGAACISGAIAVAQAQRGTTEDLPEQNHPHLQNEQTEPENKTLDDGSDGSLEVNIHIDRHYRHHSKFRNPQSDAKQNANMDNDNSNKSKSNPIRHKTP